MDFIAFYFFRSDIFVSNLRAENNSSKVCGKNTTSTFRCLFPLIYELRKIDLEFTVKHNASLLYFVKIFKRVLIFPPKLPVENKPSLLQSGRIKIFFSFYTSIYMFIYEQESRIFNQQL